MTTNSQGRPTYVPVSLEGMTRDELLERKSDLERLVRRFRTTDPEFSRIGVEWERIRKLLESRPVHARTTSTSHGKPDQPKVSRIATPLARPEFRVELVKARSTTTIQLSSYALAEIHDECQLHGWERESGGGLYGLTDETTSWSRQVRITDADVAAYRRSYAGCALDESAMRQTTQRLTRRFANKMRRCGDWHSHPERCTEPSPEDLKVWGRSLVESDRGVYVAITATAARGEPWRRPALSGWVVQPDEYLRDLVRVKPADVQAG